MSVIYAIMVYMSVFPMLGFRSANVGRWSHEPATGDGWEPQSIKFYLPYFDPF